jgi:hypothetical protein
VRQFWDATGRVIEVRALVSLTQIAGRVLPPAGDGRHAAGRP